MEMVVLISLFHAAILAVAILGAMLFLVTPAYRGVCGLLVLMAFSSIINLFEDLEITRGVYLVSPALVLGFGPAYYFAVKRLIGGPVGFKALVHFIPMILLLPFTEHVQALIAIATFWRMVYAVLTLRLIIQFQRDVQAVRSDASDVTLVWLGWLICVATCFSAADLIRLNIQTLLGEEWNMFGYAVSTFVYFIIIFVLVLILSQRKEGLATLSVSSVNQHESLSERARSAEESAADFQSLFSFLDQQMREHRWHSLPRLSLIQLSELSGMSTRDISRSINLVADVSFNDYVNQLRIDDIKKSLQTNSERSFTELAFAAGFSSKATFNQAFKKETGLTPSDYRRNLSNAIKEESR